MKNIVKGLAFSCCLFMLAGCASTSKTGGTDSLTTVSWYYTGDTSKVDNNEVFEAANKIFEKELGIHVNFNPIDSSSYEQKIKMIIAGSEDYDICWTSNWSNNYAQNVSNGAFLPLNELLGQETPVLKDSIDEIIWTGTKIHGKIYGVPNQQIMARSTAIAIPEIFHDKYETNVGEVKTLGDLTPYVTAVAQDYPGEALITISWQDLSYLYGVEEVLGTYVPGAVLLEGDANNIQVFNQYDTDMWRQVTRTRREWYEKGYTLQGKSNVTKSSYLPQEKCLEINSYKPGGDVEKSNQFGFKYVSKPLSDAYLTAGGITATLSAINAKSKNPAAALKVLELVNTNSDAMNILSFGIEGRHFVKINNDTIKITDKNGYYSTPWRFGNVFNSYLTEGMSPDAWEQTRLINQNAKVSRLLGFSPNTESIKIEINNCKSIVNEYIPSLNEGIADPDEMNKEMLGKLKQAGVDTVINELQKQINEWLASK